MLNEPAIEVGEAIPPLFMMITAAYNLAVPLFYQHFIYKQMTRIAGTFMPSR